MSDLERAQEWLGCRLDVRVIPESTSITSRSPRCVLHGGSAWPCRKATRLAALLAEVRAGALTEVAESLRESAMAVEKAKGATQRTWFMREMVSVLTNRAREVRR